MEQQPFMLSLVNMGTPEFHRYAISDQFFRYYDGDGWTESEREALLFSDPKLASKEIDRLLKLDHMSRSARQLRASVCIDLHADKDVPKAELEAWLHEFAKRLIDSLHWGNGSREGALSLTRIHWSGLEEIT